MYSWKNRYRRQSKIKSKLLILGLDNYPYSFTHSFTYLFTRSFTNTFSHSFTSFIFLSIGVQVVKTRSPPIDDVTLDLLTPSTASTTSSSPRPKAIQEISPTNHPQDLEVEHTSFSSHCPRFSNNQLVHKYQLGAGTNEHQQQQQQKQINHNPSHNINYNNQNNSQSSISSSSSNNKNTDKISPRREAKQKTSSTSPRHRNDSYKDVSSSSSSSSTVPHPHLSPSQPPHPILIKSSSDQREESNHPSRAEHLALAKSYSNEALQDDTGDSLFKDILTSSSSHKSQSPRSPANEQGHPPKGRRKQKIEKEVGNTNTSHNDNHHHYNHHQQQQNSPVLTNGDLSENPHHASDSNHVLVSAANGGNNFQVGCDFLIISLIQSNLLNI